MKDDILQFAKLPQVDLRDAAKAEKRVQLRLIKMGLGASCPRCGGSGHYSFNLARGTVCFQCNGLGSVSQKLTPALYAQAEQAVREGKLATYLENLRLERLAKNAVTRVMDAWKATGISSMYDWQRAASDQREGVASEHARISRINAEMSAAYSRVCEMERAVTSRRFEMSKGKATWRDVELAIKALVEASASAIEDIDIIAKELQFGEERCRITCQHEMRWTVFLYAVPVGNPGEEDRSQVGVYQISVHEDVPPHLLVSAALDAFHTSIGINEIDEFVFIATDGEGNELTECAAADGGAEPYSLTDRAEVEKIDDDIPQSVWDMAVPNQNTPAAQ